MEAELQCQAEPNWNLMQKRKNQYHTDPVFILKFDIFLFRYFVLVYILKNKDIKYYLS